MSGIMYPSDPKKVLSETEKNKPFFKQRKTVKDLIKLKSRHLKVHYGSGRGDG